VKLLRNSAIFVSMNKKVTQRLHVEQTIHGLFPVTMRSRLHLLTCEPERIVIGLQQASDSLLVRGMLVTVKQCFIDQGWPSALVVTCQVRPNYNKVKPSQMLQRQAIRPSAAAIGHIQQFVACQPEGPLRCAWQRLLARWQ